MDWPATAAALAAMIDPDRGVVVPGHGDQAGAAFARSQAASLKAVADLARQVFMGSISLDDAVAAHPFPDHPAEHLRRPIRRAVAQLRCERGRA
jgi:hypothetical protein